MARWTSAGRGRPQCDFVASYTCTDGSVPHDWKAHAISRRALDDEVSHKIENIASAIDQCHPTTPPKDVEAPSEPHPREEEWMSGPTARLPDGLVQGGQYEATDSSAATVAPSDPPKRPAYRIYLPYAVQISATEDT